MLCNLPAAPPLFSPILNPPINLLVPVVSSLQIPKKILVPKLVVNLEKSSVKSGNVNPYSKIEDVLKFGNIYAALKSKYLSGFEVIGWLRCVIVNPSKIKSSTISEHFMKTDVLIRVYRAICLHASEEVQLDEGSSSESFGSESTPSQSVGKHFLSNITVDMSPYQQIYILTHLSRDFYGDLDSILGVEAIRILQGKYSQLVENYASFSDTAKTRLISYPLNFFMNHQTIPKSEIVEREIILNCIKHAIDAEYFEWIHKHILHLVAQVKSIKTILLTKIRNRSIEIERAAPNYWNQVAKKGFLSILAKLNLDLSQKASIYRLYPELCPELAGLSPLSLKIMNLKSSFLRGYLLGFPIDRYLPKETEILKAASNLSKLGLKGYGVFLRQHNQRKIKYICQNPELPSEWHIPDKISNDSSTDDFTKICSKVINLDRIKENTLNDINLSKVDRISDFSPFDRIFVQSGNGFHFFTRSSFVFLLRSRKNPYNNQPLELGTLALLEGRIERAELMRLPESKTLIELLELLESGKLTIPFNDQQITSARPRLPIGLPISIQNLAPNYYSIVSGNTPVPEIIGDLMNAMGI